MISASHPLTPSCVLFLFLWSSSESHGPPGIKQVLHATPRPPWHNRRRPGVMTDTCGNIIPTSHFYIPAVLNQLQAHYPATEDVHPLSTHMQHFGLLWVHEPVQKITFHHRQKKKSPLNTSTITCTILTVCMLLFLYCIILNLWEAVLWVTIDFKEFSCFKNNVGIIKFQLRSEFTPKSKIHISP